MLRLAMVGFGAIGQALARALAGDPAVELSQVVLRAHPSERTAAQVAQLAPQARVVAAVDVAAPDRPDLLVECAGQDAVMVHVLPALRAGIPCVIASVGALHAADAFERLQAAARRGGTTARLVSGAVGGIDALAAARAGGLERVRYTGRKPPRSWTGTAAERICTLESLVLPQRIFHGSAREAAALYPKNANVAATVALAGIGLDHTEVELFADPSIDCNTHRVQASGAFGRLDMLLENLPLPENPKTSALAAYSLIRAVHHAKAGVCF